MFSIVCLAGLLFGCNSFTWLHTPILHHLFSLSCFPMLSLPFFCCLFEEVDMWGYPVLLLLLIYFYYYYHFQNYFIINIIILAFFFLLYYNYINSFIFDMGVLSMNMSMYVHVCVREASRYI